MASRARLAGLNHVVLEVGDLEDALQFYGRLFEIKLRRCGRGATRRAK
jgi:predicted enzyme related to lactoylglutathione lyase